MSTILTCTEMPPDGAEQESIAQAIAENPLNSGDSSVTFAAAETTKLWKPGRILRARFIGGTSILHAKVAQYAAEWIRYANLKLEFNDAPDAEIRVAFKLDGSSWSKVGTDALLTQPDQPTMNFGWLTDSSDEDSIKRVVYHEFGHALGLIHEHQNPAAGIPWDVEKVYSYYQTMYDWTRAQVDTNIFNKYSASQTQYTAFDASSIMCYPIPEDLTIGTFSVGWNMGLSAADRAFITKMYPGYTQPDWRWCKKCQGLWYGGGALGVCPAGGGHDKTGSSNYAPCLNSFVVGQRSWRWCKKCQGMWFSGAASSACPAGSSHDLAGSSDYILDDNGAQPSLGSGGRQSKWRWCHKCQGLFYAGAATIAGSCPAGGAHENKGSSDYQMYYIG